MSSASPGIDVSIVIINYNTPELTGDCVESVIRETAGVAYEIIVVDNGSDDPSVLTARLQGFDGVAVIRSERNLGFAGGNNLGVGHCKGEHILLLNSDTLLANNAIRLTLN